MRWMIETETAHDDGRVGVTYTPLTLRTRWATRRRWLVAGRRRQPVTLRGGDRIVLTRVWADA